jgi:hypothetical protein
MATAKIWYEDLAAWFTPDNYYVILPMDNMNTAEKLNALTRFFIYLGVILALVTLNYKYVFFGIVACLLSAALNEFEKRKQKQAEKFLDDNNLAVMDRKLCARPTTSNPFMNPNKLQASSDMDLPAGACNTSDPGVQASMSANFNAKVFKDVNDLWGRNGSQREFYTVPSTTLGGDQAGFAKWLYGTGPTCKEGHGLTCSNKSPNVNDVSGGLRA